MKKLRSHAQGSMDAQLFVFFLKHEKGDFRF